MFDRIKFKLAFKKNFPFKYDDKTGMGITPLKYSIMTNKVCYRTSRFGYVNGYSFDGTWRPRSTFLEHYSEIGN